MNKSVYILDYRCGNVKSVSRAFLSNGYAVKKIIYNNLPKESILVIPGVGHFGYAMDFIKRNNVDKLIKSHFFKGGKILGICLGMQLLFEESEEAPGVKGLGILKGKVRKLLIQNKDSVQKMHLGWSKTKFKKNLDHDMYYVHQFFCDPFDKSIINETFEWGGQDLCAGIKSNNIRGFQFHPEKSSKAGLELISTI